MREVLKALTAMATQITTLTQGFTPLVNSSVGQSTRIPTAIPLVGGERVMEMAEVVKLDPEPVQAVKKVVYLSVLQYISRMGTKHFKGSTDPIKAGEWRNRLIWNFKSSRCPDDYKKDIAVHFLEGDVHNWWITVDKRTGGSIDRIEDFEYEFNRKYFPAEAWDQLEAKFLYLTQGRKTVREYEEEFNRFRRYAGKKLEDESVQVCWFFRGLRVELRTHCSVLTFRTVSELVEKVALLETTLAEESWVKSHTQQASGSKSNDRKKKRDHVEEGENSAWMIVGNLSIGGVDTHALFDYGATHSFVSPDMIGKGMFQKERDRCFGIVNAAGGQVMHSLGLVKNILVVIQGRSMPVDLVIVRLKSHGVILDMDWLGKYRATLYCHRG
ncbi:uncharacterized protein LOC125585996 [Brassica napus]|uniref:uncharacterized protein LOC125585996 n=1 Tax=Brassica napus TaxID=3708 RepID=UPI00207A504A|nr:uncharacterized protein LOC125585996 [Brassica napus]